MNGFFNHLIFIYVFLNFVFEVKHHPLPNPRSMIKQLQSLLNCFEIQYCKESCNQVVFKKLS